MIKKVIAGVLFAAFFVSVTPVSADGGMMTQDAPVTTTQPVSPAVSTSADYDELVSKIVILTLQLFDWKNDAGEIEFTDTNYSIQYDCNTIFGSYTIDRKAVTLSTPASTLMACAEEDMDADQELIADLSKVTTLTFEDGMLVMTGADVELEFDARIPVME